MFKSSLCRLLLAAALVIAAALAGPAAAEGEVQPFAGKTTDGVDFSIDPYLGKVPILLDFGSIYCSSCIKSIPHLVVLQNEYGDRLKVVGVNMDTYGIERVKRFFAAFKTAMNFPMIIDSKLQVAKQFNIQTLPTYVLIDKNGKVASTIVGFDSETKQKMESLVKKLVDGQEISAEDQVVSQKVLLLSPDNFTSTYQEDIGVIGTTGGIDGSITVRLNGGSERRAEVMGGMFYARLPLALGSNFIEVRYPKQDGFGTSAVVIFRDPLMGEGLGANFPKYQFHVPEKEAKCTECHVMTADTEGGADGATTFCVKCHGYQVKVKFVHGPITVGGCGACHEFGSTPHKYDIEQQGAELCFVCHGDVQAKFQHAYVHGPVAMGLCISCHSPHGSQFKYQLRNQQSTMCLACHEDVRPKMGRFRQHRPLQEENCTGCHDPHSSDNPTLFLKGTGAGLCVLCHSEQKINAHSHQKEGPPTRTVDGMKLDSKGNLTCQSCHDPHSSDEDKLFTVKGGCMACHPS